MSERVSFPLDKRQWNPGLIPGPIMLVSTVDGEGCPNVAPKSWVQMVSFEPPLVLFSGQEGGVTERNVRESGCFALNIVDGRLADRAFACIRWRGEERIRRSGFRLVPAEVIAAPLVADCPAHLECRLHESRRAGSALLVIGEIVHVSVSAEIVAAAPLERYRLLDQALFLEPGCYATIRRARPAGEWPEGEQGGEGDG
jgi:flavin reductase (DIM6/NTAB) family NADH-FMN oxidoreductase RutF